MFKFVPMKFMSEMEQNTTLAPDKFVIVQDDIEHFGDVGSLDDNVESFLSNDGDGNLYGTLKQSLTEHKTEPSKSNQFCTLCIRCLS